MVYSQLIVNQISVHLVEQCPEHKWVKTHKAHTTPHVIKWLPHSQELVIWLKSDQTCLTHLEVFPTIPFWPCLVIWPENERGQRIWWSRTVFLPGERIPTPPMLVIRKWNNYLLTVCGQCWHSSQEDFCNDDLFSHTHSIRGSWGYTGFWSFNKSPSTIQNVDFISC